MLNKELYDLLVTAAADYRARGDEPAAARIERSLRSYREQEQQVGREAFERSHPTPPGVSFDETLNHYMCGASASLHARDAYQLLWVQWQARVTLERAAAAELKLAASDYAYDSARGHDRLLVRELDVLLNGEACASGQASLCDIVAQVAGVVEATGRPLLGKQVPNGYVNQADFKKHSSSEHAAISGGVSGKQHLVECDACPTSGGCVDTCMKTPTKRESSADE